MLTGVKEILCTKYSMYIVEEIFTKDIMEIGAVMVVVLVVMMMVVMVIIFRLS